MTSKDIQKLEQADQLMFDLAKSTTPKDDILKVGQLLKEAGVLQDRSDDLKTIVDAYNQDAQNEIKKATWQTEKSTADYQQLFSNLDSRRTNIHNACIDNINIFNRLIANGVPFAPWDNLNITEIKEIPRSDIGNTILGLYLSELINNDQKVLKQLDK